MSYIYIQNKIELPRFTVGFYLPSGEFYPESDWDTKEEAETRVSYLNGKEILSKVIETIANLLNELLDI